MRDLFIEVYWVLIDEDGDTVDDYLEIEKGMDPTTIDSDGDDDGTEYGPNDEPLDTDGDGTIDALDLDSDDDGLSDVEEAGDNDITTAPLDTDGDGNVVDRQRLR